ncbi:MAG: hypothetical protein GX801_08250, partial [Fibrobacter sp.]|nr:hypothetical protein [Fibrobacter sp.]
MKKTKKTNKTIVLLACLVAITHANVITTGGQNGVARTVSSYTLGKGSINAGVAVKGDYAYRDFYTNNGDNHESAWLLNEDFFIGYGITNWLDISVNMPFYQDFWENHSGIIGAQGDLGVGIKLEHIGLYKYAPFRVGYLLRMTVPTGNDKAGYFQRHANHYKHFGTNTEGAYSSRGVSLNPTMVWTLDFNLFPIRLPLLLHGNLGGIANVSGAYKRQSAVLLGNLALEYQFSNSWSSFIELAGEAKAQAFSEGYNFTTNLNDNLLRLSGGANFQA